MKTGQRTRREALGMIGKAGICLGTGPAFFASFKIVSEPQVQLKRPGEAQEKAVISGAGTKLIIIVNGRPGRSFFVAAAASDVRENYRMLPNTAGIISRSGRGEVVVEADKILDERIFLKILTADTAKLDAGLRSTEAFVINTKAGRFQSFEGLADRPILNGNSRTTVASFTAASGVGEKIRLK